MAAQPPSNSHQASQAGLVLAMAPLLSAAWSHLDIAHMAQTLPGFADLIAAIVARFSPASSTLAVRYYNAERRRAGIASPFTPRLAPAPPREQIDKTVFWATRDLSKAADLPAAERAQAIQAAETNLSGAIDRLVLDVGRNTIIDSVAGDRKARAWARVPEPGCCAFCALLSTRGAVYRTEQTASFLSHDHCRCHVEPVFGIYEPTAQVRDWQGQHARLKDAHGGVSLNLWRQHFEGRLPVDQPVPAGR